MALSPPVLGVLDTAREAFTEAQEEALQHLVVALNWLTLGQTSFPPESARKGFPMSQQQMDMLDYLDGLVDHFLRAGEVSSESLGSAGEKLSKLAKHAFNLDHPSLKLDVQDVQSFLSVLQRSFDSWSHVRDLSR